MSGDANNSADDFQIVLVDAPWIDTELSWNNLPVYLPHKDIARFTGGTNNSWRDIDITPTIQNFVIDPAVNHGFVFDTHVEGRKMIVNSSEADDVSLRPKLTITYDNDDITAINPILDNISDKICIKKTPESFMIYIPDSRYHTITMYTVSGLKIESLGITGSKKWYVLPEAVTPGLYIISIASREGTFFKKINTLQ